MSIRSRSLTILPILATLSLSTPADDAPAFDRYVSGFDYAARKEMKLGSRELIALMKQGRIQLIDIRFEEEYAAWHLGPSVNIPIDELPTRLDEIDRDRIVVTACPHKDRAVIAMAYLRSKGIAARYLKDGLLGLLEELRGDEARDLMAAISSRNTH